MRTFFETAIHTLAVLAVVDLLILLWMSAAIIQGAHVAHIPFWDAQLRFIFSLWL